MKILKRLYKYSPTLCLLTIVVPVSAAGIALRVLMIDVPEITRICASSSPPSWCEIRALTINPRTYIFSFFIALIALHKASVNWSLLSIAIGTFGLFSFNPHWSNANPDWSLAGLTMGLLAFLRSQESTTPE